MSELLIAAPTGSPAAQMTDDGELEMIRKEKGMDVSVGHVSNLAKRAVGAGWLKVQGRKYILVSGMPV